MGQYSPNRVLLLLLVLCTVFMAVQGALPVYATSSTSFDTTDVLRDLTAMTIDGQPFDITDYPYNQLGSVRVIMVTEYCYSYRENMRENYSLYVYVYNPQGLVFVESQQNKLQLTTSTNYSKYELTLCGKTNGDYNHLFYKFKVKDIDSLADTLNSNERIYKVSGIELMTSQDRTATEYGISTTYKYTGYAKGCGPDASADSTLACTTDSLETIQLDVRHTFYRTLTSSKGDGYQNQLDTVYFAVPKHYFNTYGTLQRIKAEWYEYKSKDIVVTSNADFYNAVHPYVGTLMQTEYNQDVGYSLGQDAGDYGGGLNAARWGWNLGTGYLHPPCQRLSYLFKVDDISNYDPYADVVSIGGVESNTLYEYIFNYNNSFDNGKLPSKSGQISADLFESDIDDYRKVNNDFGKVQQGYSYYDFDADVDLQTLSSWSQTQPTFWDNWVNFGLWSAMVGNIPTETSRTVSPIYTLKANDLNGNTNEVAERLLINSADVTKLRTFYNTNTDKEIVLFRFATTDYYSAPIDIIQLNKGFMWSDKFSTGQAYRAQESVFLDFDIIQLTFTKQGVVTIIPVVANPIDIVNSITPPLDIEDNQGWWKVLIGLVALILLVVLLAPVLPYILQALIWFVSLPIKAVKAIVVSIKKTKTDKENDK